jgi:SAM-dependent methyltransferase
VSATIGAPKSIDIGCGTDKLPGSVGVDANPRSHADVIHDLDVFPWPFESDSFDRARAFDVLEHVRDFNRVVEEIHRICKADATVFVRMPFAGGFHHIGDPTHVRGASYRTFDYFDPRTELGRYRYSAAELEVSKFRYERVLRISRLGNFFRRLDKFLLPIIERNALDYELYFCGIYPMHNVYFELRVKK